MPAGRKAHLVNILQWAGLPTEPDPTTYVADDYWDVAASEQTVGFYSDPTPEIEQRQNSLLIETFARATDTDLELLEQLVTDGGHAHYTDLADKTGRSISTLYRVLERLPEAVESDNGTFKLVSEKIRQDIAAIVRPLEEQVLTKADAVAHLLEIDRERLQQKGAAFQQWLTTYAVDLQERERDDGSGQYRLTIEAAVDRLRSTSVPQLDEVLLEGLRAWRDAGLDPAAFHNARLTWVDSTGETHHGIVKSVLR